MIIQSEILVDNIYPNNYEYEGKEVHTFTLEVKNPDATNKFNQRFSYPIDKTIHESLLSNELYKKLIGRKCKVEFGQLIFKDKVNLVVTKITPLQ